MWCYFRMIKKTETLKFIVLPILELWRFLSNVGSFRYLSICNKVQANCEQIDQKLKLLGQKERELERELRQCKEIAQCITDKLEKTKEELRNLETQLESYVNVRTGSSLSNRCKFFCCKFH